MAVPEAAPSGAEAVARRGTPSAAQVEAMALFQETMRQFLETQRAVMTGFLASQGAGVAIELPAPPAPHAAPPRQAAPRAPQPAAPLRPAAPSAPPAAPPAVPHVVAAAPAPVAPAPAAVSAVPGRPPVDVLLEIAGDRTGYPPDMLGLDANLEADLGIDSIKRVEIIAAFRRALLPSMGEPPASFMERVTAAKTLRQIVAEVTALQQGAK